MALKSRTLKSLGLKQSFCPAPVGSRGSWKDSIGANKKDLACLKKKKKK